MKPQSTGMAATITLLVAAVILSGCAKRLVTATASAPPPPAASAPASSVVPAPRPSATGPPPVASAPAEPGTVRPAPKEFVATADLKDIRFNFDKYAIRPEDGRILDANATWLKTHPNHLLLIEGHCDERGTNEYNLALGGRRAQATMTYLVGQGVAASRISIVSYGEERPLCAEHNETCWAQNRRAHFLVKPI